ncbi:Zinc knuckle CX2CX4HX4C [Arabidopsis suecica]|uniref:Zinc knuckle CX2CX4HX4C n=1 Tax=Arabidopsis suecica TaxID=45249 RepID=A0A8T2BT14_ARASU|nr:Zinc knuckle CX2CX4HX4C [Arabidopsis suecica]
MADRLWDELQNFNLGRDDPELYIPLYTYVKAVDRNRLNIIARPLNLRAQSLHSVVSSLPRTWGLTSRVQGRVLNGTYVQFLFQSETDLVSVQLRAPWIFKNWFVASHRWEDFPEIHFLTTIDLWVQISGIPLPYVSDGTIRFIAQTLGEIIYVDFSDEYTTQITFTRVRVRFEITTCLRFFRRVCFESKERAMLSFQYEHLRRICSNCLRLTHQRSHCPYNNAPPTPRNSPEVLDVPVFNRRRVSDEDTQSELNSQSQNSDYSFSAPLPPPPRVHCPPLNPDEQAAASLYFPRLSFEGLRHSAHPSPQPALWRRLVSSGSNISLTNEEDSSSRMTRNFEVGESSRCPSSSLNRQGEDKNQKHKLQAEERGGILKPPKKRESLLKLLS